ncbi:MAG: DUF87 domain-containing protein [Candidatus Gracilibacteria bacterium]|nr:DUF87 domain-containing protein [Candidatus Gracilibacteria bacterium]
MNEHFTYEVFPRRIEDETFLLASIKTDMNGLVNIKAEYTFKYLLFRNETGIYLKQYISSNSEAGISFLLNFYEKLYSGSIAFKKVNNPLLLHRSKHYYSIKTNHSHVFQICKPGEIGLNTFSSSTGLIENVFNETALILKQGEFTQFEFKIIPSSYDQLTKAFLYTIKEIGKSEEYKEQLNGSFTDKLGFFLFDLKICHNLDNEKVFGEILYKNLRLYDSNWNYYEYKYSNKDYPKVANRYRKGQMDMFLSHGLVSLISENNRYVKKLPSSIIPISPTLALNNGTGKKKGAYKTFIGKGFRDLRLNNQEYVALDLENLKNQHSIILGGTGAGKSFTTSQMIGFDTIKTIMDDKKKFEEGELLPKSQVVIEDPHGSLKKNFYGMLSIFNQETFLQNMGNFQITEYVKNLNKEIIEENLKDLPFKRSKLVFNPLYLGDLKTSDPDEFLRQVNKASESCLDSIKGIYDETSFGAQNSEILFTVIKLFVIFNGLKIEANKNLDTGKNNEDKKIFTLSDIHKFLKYLEIHKSLPDWIKEDFKRGLNSEHSEIALEVAELKENIEYYLTQLQKNSGYLSSSINKVSDFSGGLKETFGGNTNTENYSLSLEEFFLKNDYQKTNIYFFDLGDFTQKEKAIVSSFILAYSYHYGTVRNYQNKKNLTKTSVWIDEADVILHGANILNIVASELSQVRKFGFQFSFFYQSVDQEAFRLIYPNIGFMLVFSVDNKQFDLIGPDLNSGCFLKQLEAKDIINNQRGRFYGFFKFINGGNSTVLIEGFGMNTKEIKYLIS